MGERAEHGLTLFGLVATPSTVAPLLRLQVAHGEEFIDIGDGIILGGAGLVEPQGTEGIQGISIEVGELRTLLPHALSPGVYRFRDSQGVVSATRGRSSAYPRAGPVASTMVGHGMPSASWKVLWARATNGLVMGGTQHGGSAPGVATPATVGRVGSVGPPGGSRVPPARGHAPQGGWPTPARRTGAQAPGGAGPARGKA